MKGLEYEFEKSNLWQRWRAFWVNIIKTRAIYLFNKTEKGELFLLKMYFLAEKSTVVGINEQLQELAMPAWLKDSLKVHLQEEGQHIKCFAEAIRSRGDTPPKLTKSNYIDWLKLRPWIKLTQDYQAKFKHGALIPAYVIGECAEYMVIRVLKRHERALDETHPLKLLLGEVLADEERHLKICYETLDRLVYPEEQSTLALLRKKVYQVDFSWGTTTAVAQYCVGLYFLARHKSGFFTR